ncbi:leucine rich repeat protein [Ichthyophthirius multifiliis]|uniref:Leucine rich repeat protein n=1 Tax=Ichthyophthirius multifiliis TaxID=5932 RepID=G0R2A4_ICHMU|nr:leucine rich repeat protein [Ichthyophthirius multifiliis]EGR28401.1 leucine rich repeat protein [Ichthyophthirius multifiliis]|eukprot:XP_004027746.1 leucine rich repeat protein [Ichthyophthirius multifiliis]
MDISKDEKFLFVGLRSIGVNIYDIRQVDNLILFETLPQTGLAINLKLNQDENLIFFSDSFNFMVFQRSIPNFNSDKPNLLNFVQNNLFNDHMGDDKWTWRCDYKNYKLYTASSSNGTICFDTNVQGNSLKILSLINQVGIEDSNITDSVFVMNQQYVLGGISSGGLSIISYEEGYNKPKVINQSQYGFTDNDSDSIFLNENQTLAVIGNGNRGVTFLNINNLMDIQLISNFQPSEYGIIGTCEDALFTKDLNFAFATIRNYGVIALDIKNMKKPLLINKLYTRGGEGLAILKNQRNLIITDGFNGLTSVDISNPFSMVILHTLKLNGWTLHLRIIQNDQYALVTQTENGQLYLVDIRDLQNMQILQQFQYYKDNTAYDICLNEDLSKGFLMTKKGIVIMNLKNNIIIHTEIMLVQHDSFGQVYKTKLDKGTILKIGEQIELHNVFIYSKRKIIFKKAYYYNNLQLNELPDWINFDLQTGIVQIQIQKEALKKNKQNIYAQTQKQIILLAYEEVQSEDFINKELNIDINKANDIFNNLFELGIINIINIITDKFNTEIKFRIEGQQQSQKIIKYIEFILKSKINYYPIEINIDSSLRFDFKNKQRQIITNQDTLIIYLEINEDDGKFQDIKYQGVLVSLSYKQNQIKIEGDTNSILNLLTRGIKLAIKKPIDDIKIQIKVIDYINYDIETVERLQDLQFINLNQPVRLNPELNLQQSFNKQYNEGKIYILEQFSFQIGNTIFIDKDNDQLTFSAKIYIDNKLYDIPVDFWLQFQPNERKFVGQPSLQEYNQIIKLLIISTDGYTEASDYLQIIVSKIPFTYIITMAVQILGPIVGVFGLWKYRFIIYNIMYRKNFFYSDEIAYEAYGFTPEKLGIINKNKGECIHESYNNIQQVRFYTKQQQTSNSLINKIHRFLGSDYQQIGLSNNQKIPAWFKSIELLHGVLLFIGLPQRKDIGEILVRIFNEDGYILRQFLIVVVIFQFKFLKQLLEYS